MHTRLKIAFLLASSLSLMAGATAKPAATGYSGSQCADPALTPQQRAGCEIWFYATAGNGRFHTYVLPQRIVDQSLIANLSTRLIGQNKEVLQQIIVNADRDSRLSGDLHFRR